MPAIYRPIPTRRLISLTPLIDVVFILLIFFMLASSFLDWRAIELELPSRANSGATDDAILVVSIEEGAAIKLNGETVTDTDLSARLAERLANDPGLRIFVRAAEGVPLQRAIHVLEAVTATGGRNVFLSSHKRATP